MENKVIEEKILLLGKYVIVNDGDFKGVSGLLKSIDIQINTVSLHGGANKKDIVLSEKENINCEVIVNNTNTINVPLEYLSKLI